MKNIFEILVSQKDRYNNLLLSQIFFKHINIYLSIFENGTGIKINNSNRNKLTNIKELMPYNYRLRPTPLAGSTRKFTLSA